MTGGGGSGLVCWWCGANNVQCCFGMYCMAVLLCCFVKRRNVGGGQQ